MHCQKISKSKTLVRSRRTNYYQKKSQTLSVRKRKSCTVGRSGRAKHCQQKQKKSKMLSASPAGRLSSRHDHPGETDRPLRCVAPREVRYNVSLVTGGGNYWQFGRFVFTSPSYPCRRQCFVQQMFCGSRDFL